MKYLLLLTTFLILLGCTHTVDRFRCDCDCNTTKFSCSENDIQIEIESP